MNISSEIGYMATAPTNRIAEIRKSKGLSQQQLADLLGAHWITVSKLERGKMQLTSTWMVRLSEALGMEAPDFLLERKKEGEIPLLGEITEGGIVRYFEDDKVSKFIEARSEDMTSDWLQVSGHDLEPFFFAKDLIKISYVMKHEFEFCEGRVGFITLKDGRDLFGVLHKSLGEGRFDIRTLRYEIIANVEVEDFGLFTGCMTRVAVHHIADKA